MAEDYNRIDFLLLSNACWLSWSSQVAILKVTHMPYSFRHIQPDITYASRQCP